MTLVNRFKALAASRLIAASLGALLLGTSLAGAEGNGSWWQRKQADQDQTHGSNGFGFISNFNSSAGKATTATEIVADRGERPMVSAASDQMMAAAISQYQSIVASGGWPRVESARLRKGSSSPEIATLKRRLAMEGYLTDDALAGENSGKFTEATQEALARYQRNNGLAPTGKLDKPTVTALNVPVAQRLATLRANQPRIQTYSADLGPRYIVVNVPALQLEAVNNGTVYSRHNVIAGQPSRPTPVVIASVSDIYFNPFWNAPVSIVEKDIIPRVQKEGVRTLRDQRIRVFDGYKGPEVDPETIDWDNLPADRYFFRQDPGGDNAMATMKINFPSPFGIYLHDTPTKSLFGTGARYLSSGCVRVEKVHVLANWILNGQDGWNPQRIEATGDSGEPLDVTVTNPPQLRVIYLTAWPTASGPAQFRPDIYDLDSTGFVVGQPLPPGELSDTGQRFVLKAVPRLIGAISAGDPDQENTSPRSFRRKPVEFASFRKKMPVVVDDEEPAPKSVIKGLYSDSVMLNPAVGPKVTLKKHVVGVKTKKTAAEKVVTAKTSRKTVLPKTSQKVAAAKASTAMPTANSGKPAIKPGKKIDAAKSGQSPAKPIKKKKLEEVAATLSKPVASGPTFGQ